MTDKNPSNFGDMMIKYFCANCERLKLAEARFRAAEELILEPSALPTEGFLDNELYVKDYILWQQSIVAYDAAVKGEGE